MHTSRFTETQIVAVLKRLKAGAKAADVRREFGISETTLYTWRAKYGGLEVSDLRRLRELEDENRRLKKIVADQVLNIEALTSVAEGTSRACSSPRSRAGRGSAHPSRSAAPMPLAGYQPQTLAQTASGA
jgi:putative transposase